MAFPNTPVLSTFSVADQSPAPGFSGPITSGVGEVNVQVIGQAAAAAAGVVASGWLTNQLFGPDIEIWATPTTAPGDGNYVSLLYRLYDPGTATPSYYELRAWQQAPSPASNYFELVKRYISGSTIAMVGNFSQPWLQGDSFGARVIGTTHELWYKPAGGAWTRLATWSDSTHTAAGFMGIKLMFAAARLDDLGGGDGSGSGTVIQPGMSNWYKTLLSADQEVYCDIIDRPLGQPFSLVARLQNPGTTSFSCYALEMSDTYLKIRKWVAGAATDILTLGTFAIAAGYSIGMDVQGSLITVSRRDPGGAWVTLGSASDTSIAGQGYAGMWSMGNTGWIIDNFGAGNLSALPARTIVETGAGVAGRTTW